MSFASDRRYVALMRSHLDPVLGPRGWTFEQHSRGTDGGEECLTVLYHADPDSFEELFPGYGARLRSSYGDQEPPCYDVWLTFFFGAGRAHQDLEGAGLVDVLRSCGEAELAERVTVLTDAPEADLAALAHGLSTALDALASQPPP